MSEIVDEYDAAVDMPELARDEHDTAGESG